MNGVDDPPCGFPYQNYVDHRLGGDLIVRSVRVQRILEGMLVRLAAWGEERQGKKEYGEKGFHVIVSLNIVRTGIRWIKGFP